MIQYPYDGIEFPAMLEKFMIFKEEEKIKR